MALEALWQDVATQIEYVNQGDTPWRIATFPDKRGEQTVKETKTAWLDWERRFKGNAIGEMLGRSTPPHTHTHAPSSASPVCLDTTEKLGEVNIFVLLFFHLLFVIYKGMNGMKVYISFILPGLQS